MYTELHHCAWCGTSLEAAAGGESHSCFCPECEAEYEAEEYRPLYPYDVREPHDND